MAINTIDKLVAALAGKQQQFAYYRLNTTTQRVGVAMSSWRLAGIPGAGATPSTGSGQTYTSATAGAFPFTNPTGGDKTYVAAFTVASPTIHQAYLLDRLVATSGLSGTVTTSQAINTVALPARVTNADGVIMYIEHYANTGTTATNATITYTNSAGVAGRTTTFLLAIPLAAIPSSGFVQVPLQAGDVGVQSVQSILLSNSTGTAGNFGVTLARRLTGGVIQPAVVSVAQHGPLAGGLPVVADDACLFMSIFSNAGTTLGQWGSITLVQG